MKKGDSSGKGRGGIEEAATQILRGLNGMVEFLATHPHFFEYTHKIDLLPVIFTTARLWTSEVILSDADLATGKADLSTAPFAQRSWLLYQYHTSPGLKHAYQLDLGSSVTLSDALGVFLERDYVRTIPIVSPSGIPEFLRSAGELEVE